MISGSLSTNRCERMYKEKYLQESLKKWWKGLELDEYLKRIDAMFKK